MKRNYLLICLVLLRAICSVCVAQSNPRVVFETNFGDITIELYPEDAPVTVGNYLGYVNSGFYDGVLFHRVIYEFMIQGGVFYIKNDKLNARTPGDPIVNESDNGLSNVRGTISTALGGGPDTATSQFFINHKDNIYLDYPNVDGYGHCVFGDVVEGMDVVDAIAQTPTYDYSYWFGPSFKYFPDDPLVFIIRAYELPCEFSYYSDLALAGQINFEDFALFSHRWLDSSCGESNDFCDGADLDHSGEVDIVDLDLFWNHWSRTAGYETRFSDLAYNHTIDTADLFNLISRWLDSACTSDNNYCDQADINRDGNVDLTDYSMLAAHWLGSY